MAPGRGYLGAPLRGHIVSAVWQECAPDGDDRRRRAATCEPAGWRWHADDRRGVAGYRTHCRAARASATRGIRSRALAAVALVLAARAGPGRRRTGAGGRADDAQASWLGD